MKAKFFKIWDLTGRYFSLDPNSDKVKQLCRKVLLEELGKCNKLTGNKFLCLLTDESALAEVKPGDVIRASLYFDVSDDFQQLVSGEIESVNGVLILNYNL